MVGRSANAVIRIRDSEISPPVEQTWLDQDGRAWGVCRSEGAEKHLTLTGLGTFRLRLDTGEVDAEPAAGVAAEIFERAYWLEAVPMLHQSNGALCLHASAAECEDGAICFAGPKTAGKSTLARAWSLQEGRAQLADDMVVLYEEDLSFEVQPLPFWPKLRPPMDQRLAPTEPPEPGPAHSKPVGPVRRIYLLQAESESADFVIEPLGVEALPLVLQESVCFLLADLDSRTRFFDSNLNLLEKVAFRRLVYPHREEVLDGVLDAINLDLRSGSQIME